jgi:SAM-dependent methyltransferase
MTTAAEERPDKDTVHRRRARSFGAAADDYDRYRPTYPAAAVDWLVPAGARDVADVGAGTGKLTGLLLERGLRVTAIEPDPAMAAVLTRARPGAEVREAGADALPLADAAVDAVVVGQAWHWFPHERAAAEIRRVLRPGGRLGLIWNQLPPGLEPWQEEIERLNSRARGTELERPTENTDAVEVDGLPSDELEAANFAWSEELEPAFLRARMATYSHIALLPEDEREALLDEVAAIAAAETARRGTTTVAYRHVAYCVRWTPAGTD